MSETTISEFSKIINSDGRKGSYDEREQEGDTEGKK